MTFTVLDIETAAGPLAQAEADALRTRPYPYEERFPPDNYKKEETIAKWRAADEAAWPTECAKLAEALLKEAALSPRLGRLVAVGVKRGTESSVRTALSAADEPTLAIFATAAVSQGTLVTFNGLTFDLPFIHVRAAVLGVAIPYSVSSYLRRYSVAPHADVRAILTNWDQRTTGTLPQWAAAFGIESTDTTTGADIGKMVEANDAAGVIAHCTNDLNLTHHLAERVRSAGLF